jgi:MoxR-like ATPase
MANNHLSLKSLSSRLKGEGYIHREELAAQIYSALHQKPVGGAFLFGSAGSGKTYLPEVLNNILDMEYCFYQICPGTREDDLVQKMLPNESTISGISLYDGKLVEVAKITSEGRKAMLVLDEWDKSRHSADAFLLDFLQTGRISFPNVEVRANLDNLIVFITMNDERHLSEPLLRRLPMINFSMPHPELVKDALEMSHPDNAMVEAVVTLYKRCVVSGIKKPVTIQEMRQLLDAIKVLGKDADWNTLVYEYITKTPENHQILKEHEEDRLPEVWRGSGVSSLSADKYSSEDASVPESDTASVALPALPKIRGMQKQFVMHQAPDNIESQGNKIFGLIKYSKKSYDAFVHDLADVPMSRAASLDKFTLVSKKYLLIRKPIPLREAYRLQRLWQHDGEICFVEDGVHWMIVKALQESMSLEITKFSRSEIIGRVRNRLHMRWTRTKGVSGGMGKLEVIVNLKHQSAFYAFVGADKYSSAEGTSNGWMLAGMSKIDKACHWKKADEIEYKRRYGWVYRKHIHLGWRPRNITIQNGDN